MNRRKFFFSWIAIEASNATPVKVMAVFSASGGPSAFLVHHANEATRYAFGEWLRANNGKRVVCQLPDGTRVDGRIFRISLCFGRGLILTYAPIGIRAKDILNIY